MLKVRMPKYISFGIPFGLMVLTSAPQASHQILGEEFGLTLEVNVGKVSLNTPCAELYSTLHLRIHK